MKIRLLTLIMGAFLLTAACSNGGKLGKNSNEEILAKYQTCADSEPTGTYAMTCNNIVKECERRKSKGANVCRI